MKKSNIIHAFFAAALLVPTSAFANYYSYQACIEQGGNFFTCAVELIWDNGEIAPPDFEEQFGFVKDFKEEQVHEAVKMASETCDKTKGEERLVCYGEGLKKYLMDK